MNGLRIIGLGMCTLDVLIRCKDLPTWEHGTRISAFGFDGGGPVGTAMVAAAKLGARVGFIGTAGNDVSAEFKLRSMRECGIDLSCMVYRDAPEDQVVVVNIHAETGERIFSGIQRWGNEQIRPEELDRDDITAADYLHLDGFHNAAALQAAQWMQAAGKTVVLDGHKTDGLVGEHLHRLIPHVDILISGSGFARGLTGIDDIYEAGAAILALGPRIFVQTEGADGSYTITAEEQFHTPAFPVDVIDTTGAGDVFHGAYIVGLLHGWSLQQIALFSTAVSALKCMQLGGRAGIPRFDAVMAFLQERGVTIE
ncbi:MAG: carbohydrate kinase family protein [Anaerolineae bacterium]|nr:carbohydrate kinase family protein [Anaerolineae bacterium]